VDKYLRQYAEPGTAAVAEIPLAETWQQVVVIPVCNESTDILRPLPPAPGRVLKILVVNQAETAADHVSIANREFSAQLHGRFKMAWQSGGDSGLTLFHDQASPRDVLLVDRFSDGLRLPAKGGVGQARKTGADLAASLIQQQCVLSPWIHCTDADVHLPQRYFTCVEELNENHALKVAALIYPFRHRLAGISESTNSPHAGKPGDRLGSHRQRVMRVTRLYEYSLRYYVAGLAFAGSPYAFHTIGSTMAVNAAHYARVRGFPRRQAGEDFYLLNKLAKVGDIRQLSAETDCDPIDISARLSDRVPFGTGAATGRIMALDDPVREFLLYHPAIFGLLQIWLGSLDGFWQSQSGDIGDTLSRRALSGLTNGVTHHESDDLKALVQGLEYLGVAEVLGHAFRQSKDPAQFKKQMHIWFDAFRTLKLVHYLRDHHFPSISFEALVTEQCPEHLMRHESMLVSLHKKVCRDWLDSGQKDLYSVIAND
jgi:hypothetical protein